MDAGETPAAPLTASRQRCEHTRLCRPRVPTWQKRRESQSIKHARGVKAPAPRPARARAEP